MAKPMCTNRKRFSSKGILDSLKIVAFPTVPWFG